jgi:predicted amidohydrolase
MKLSQSLLLGLPIFSLCLIFSKTQGQTFNAAEWRFESQRKAIAPVYFVDDQVLYEGNKTLALQGGDKPYADGHWYKEVSVQPGKYFRFRVCFKTDKVEEPHRSVVARIIWQSRSGAKIGSIVYPAFSREKAAEGWQVMEQVYQVPAGAEKAKLELHYRWDGDGSVHFGSVAFSETPKPAPRMVRMATIKFRPAGTASSMENLEKFSKYIADAAARKADIVCLPEEVTLVGTGQNWMSANEPVPGPSTEYLGKLAKKYHLYIVAGILEKAGDVVYNTAVLLDRKGKLAGKYHKLSLPDDEIDGGITPGDSLPVFDTDFGRIGIMICWDVSFPETARTLAKKGAEIIFLPIWGGNITLARARAIENQVYLVSSSYDMATAIIDQDGRLAKEATAKEPVVTLDVDLNKQKLWDWIGDYKNRIPRETPPESALRN